jgi:hypothetical protein
MTSQNELAEELMRQIEKEVGFFVHFQSPNPNMEQPIVSLFCVSQACQTRIHLILRMRLQNSGLHLQPTSLIFI